MQIPESLIYEQLGRLMMANIVMARENASLASEASSLSGTKGADDERQTETGSPGPQRDETA